MSVSLACVEICGVTLCCRQITKLLEDNGGREAILAYHEKIATTQIYLRDCTCVPIIGVILLCGRLVINKTRTSVIAGGWLKFKTVSELQAVLYKTLQSEITKLLELKLLQPSAATNDLQDRLIEIVSDLA